MPVPLRALRVPATEDGVQIPGIGGRLKTFGTIWHGRVTNGVFDSPPVGITPEVTDKVAGLGVFRTDGTGQDEMFNQRRSSRFQVPGMPAPTIDAEMAAFLAAKGGSLFNYGLLVGRGEGMYMGLPPSGTLRWFYADPQGDVWTIKLSDYILGITHTGTNYVYDATKTVDVIATRNIIRSTHARQISDTPHTYAGIVVDTDIGSQYQGTLWSLGTVSGIPIALGNAFVPGSISSDGSKCVLNLSSPASRFAPIEFFGSSVYWKINFSSNWAGNPAGRYGVDFTAYPTRSLRRSQDVNAWAGPSTSVNASWLVEITGTPGVDWVVTITKIGMQEFIPAVADPSLGDTTRLVTASQSQTFNVYVHSFVTPAGDVKHLTYACQHDIDIHDDYIDAPTGGDYTFEETMTLDYDFAGITGTIESSDTYHFSQTSSPNPDYPAIDPDPDHATIFHITIDEAVVWAGSVFSSQAYASNQYIPDPGGPLAYGISSPEGALMGIPSCATEWFIWYPLNGNNLFAGDMTDIGLDQQVANSTWIQISSLGSSVTTAPAPDHTALKYRIATDGNGTVEVYNAGDFNTDASNTLVNYV